MGNVRLLNRGGALARGFASLIALAIFIGVPRLYAQDNEDFDSYKIRLDGFNNTSDRIGIHLTQQGALVGLEASF